MRDRRHGYLALASSTVIHPLGQAARLPGRAAWQPSEAVLVVAPVIAIASCHMPWRTSGSQAIVGSRDGLCIRPTKGLVRALGAPDIETGTSRTLWRERVYILEKMCH